MFFRITLPFIIPLLNVTIVLTLKQGFVVFDYIKAMTEGGPAGATESVAIMIFLQGFKDMRFGYAVAESVFLLLVISIISIGQLKLASRYEVGQL
jgi:raffinose/stachyose/melibiose transport system permease protein